MLTLIALAVMGHGVRLLATDGLEPGAVSLLPPRDSASLGVQRDRVERLMRPLEKGERIDFDTAPMQELMRLPRIGPGLAKAIVGDREQRGPFGSLASLQRVSGIGPALIRRVQPFAAFSGFPRVALANDGAPAATLDINRATVDQLVELPGIGPTRAASLVAYRELHGPFASLESLTDVPGVGQRTVDRLRGRVRLR